MGSDRMSKLAPIIRSAAPFDALAVAQVHVRAWQAGYRELLPAAFLDGLRPEERAARYTFADPDPDSPKTLVALVDGTIRGFVTTLPAKEAESAGQGELAGLYVDPDFWGQGLGQALMIPARARLAERGFAAAVLWVLDGNVRADRFYRADGWQTDGMNRTQEVWGLQVREHRFTRTLP